MYSMPASAQPTPMTNPAIAYARAASPAYTTRCRSAIARRLHPYGFTARQPLETNL